MTEAQLRSSIERFSRFPPSGKLNIVKDTTEFMDIKPGDVLELGDRFYLVRGEETEGRFGLDGEPKFWVKRVVDLEDGSPRILKLVFHESFVMRLGEQDVKCFRSPAKEARILDKVRGDVRFMQGFTVYDRAGNAARILDRIQGARFYDFIHDSTPADHRAYFDTQFLSVFEKIVGCIEAIHELHRLGELHGDIRNDHIFIERGTGIYRWIDFDYSYDWSESPYGVDLFGLGNILLFTVGKGFHLLRDLNACSPPGLQATSCLTREDMSLFFNFRIINLKKLFPYIPESLNHVLLHFSQGAEVFYETTGELLDDLRASMDDLRQVCQS